MKVTQKDIAARLNISASLVSRALAGTAVDIGASEETVRRIREEAEKLNYHPSQAALALRGRSTKTIGLVIKDFDDPFFGLMVRTLQGLAREEGYSLLMTGCDLKDDAAKDMASLARHQLDGLVICGSDFAPDGLDSFLEKGLPTVQIGIGAKNPKIACVSMDQAKGMDLLVDFLKGLGHTAIGYVGGENDSNLRREAVLVDVMKRRGMKIRDNWFVRASGNGAEAGYAGMKRLAAGERENIPTAVILADDVHAISGMRACYEAGLKVPSDLSIAGVDDIPFAHMAIPALTTVRQPIEQMAGAAFKLVTGGDSGNPSNVVVRPGLVVRESCAAPRR